MFCERGLDGVAISDVMKAAGLTHGSFYNHFGSKVDLTNACIVYGASKALAAVDSADASLSGKKAFVDEYLSVRHRNDHNGGCLLSALASEVVRKPHAQGPMTRFVHAFIDKMSTHFPWPKPRSARPEAIRAIAAMVGALVLAKALNDSDLSQEILAEVSHGLKEGFR